MHKNQEPCRGQHGPCPRSCRPRKSRRAACLAQPRVAGGDNRNCDGSFGDYHDDPVHEEDDKGDGDSDGEGLP